MDDKNRHEVSVNKLNDKNGPSEQSKFVEAPFAPPPMIGRCWDLLMTYTKIYEKFCMEIFGQILVRKRTVDYDSWTLYKAARKDCTGKKKPFKKYHGLKSIWPEYTQLSEYKNDVESTSVVWISEN